ncbi:MAG: YcxB family protein [Erythrobacter sp.]|uniref:YcxB family protein n=1 Tax=Erythrobacter sp. TaxID=1042 RepID=UPI0032652AB3
MADFSFTQEFDLDQAVEAHAVFSRVAHSKSNPRATFIVIFLILVLLSIGISDDKFPSILWGLIWIPVCGALSWLIIWPPKRLLTLGLKRQIVAYREQVGASSESSTYYFKGEEIRVETGTSTETLTLTDLYGWHENDGLLLLYRAPKSYYFIVKSQLDSYQIDSLRQCLLAYTGKPFRGW